MSIIKLLYQVWVVLASFLTLNKFYFVERGVIKVIGAVKMLTSLSKNVLDDRINGYFERLVAGQIMDLLKKSRTNEIKNQLIDRLNEEQGDLSVLSISKEAEKRFNVTIDFPDLPKKFKSKIKL